MSQEPSPKPCFGCGTLLKPQAMGSYIDGNYNTKTTYMYGHHCPEKEKAYKNRLKEIGNNLNMNNEQKANARYLAGFMNSWGN